LFGIHTIENIRRSYGLISVMEGVLGIFEKRLGIKTYGSSLFSPQFWTIYDAFGMGKTDKEIERVVK